MRTLLAQRHAVRDARAAAPAPAFAQSLMATLAATLRVRTPRLVIGDAATGPYVVGVVRSIIVVPPAAALRTAAASGLASPRSLDARVAAVLGPPIRARMSLVHKAALLGWTLVALGGARTAAARGETEVCEYTPEIAETLREAHPEADLDGDGYLSKHEACELQAKFRHRAEADGTDQVSTVVDEPLCCNCDPGDRLIPSAGSPDASCQRSEGVE